MQNKADERGMVLRLFQVKTKPGCAAALMEKFATTSIDVVRHEPGNKGYFFGRGMAIDEDMVVFASLWDHLESVKRRFGEDWQSSYLPEGYEDLIEECSVHHIDVGNHWKVGQDD